MTTDRIARICISGLRALSDLQLRVGGLTVLIGENGTGKSTLIEAFELMRKAALPTSFVQDIVPKHGGLEALVRRGAGHLEIEDHQFHAVALALEETVAASRPTGDRRVGAGVAHARFGQEPDDGVLCGSRGPSSRDGDPDPHGAH